MEKRKTVDLLKLNQSEVQRLLDGLNGDESIKEKIAEQEDQDQAAFRLMAQVAFGMFVAPKFPESAEEVDSLNEFELTAAGVEIFQRIVGKFDLISLTKEELEVLKGRAEDAQNELVLRACNILLALFGDKKIAVNQTGSRYQKFDVPFAMISDFPVREQSVGYAANTLGAKLNMSPRKA